MTLPYDPANPPERPPSGCDRLTWTLAFHLRLAHLSGPSGDCVAWSCQGIGVTWPCQVFQIAEAGLLGSVGWWAGLGLDRPTTRWPAQLRPNGSDSSAH